MKLTILVLIIILSSCECLPVRLITRRQATPHPRNESSGDDIPMTTESSSPEGSSGEEDDHDVTLTDRAVQAAELFPDPLERERTNTELCKLCKL